MVEIERERFEAMVGEALDGLPPDLGRLMRNVAVTVDHDAGPAGLLGLYRGVPLTNRTTHLWGSNTRTTTVVGSGGASIFVDEVATRGRTLRVNSQIGGPTMSAA